MTLTEPSADVTAYPGLTIVVADDVVEIRNLIEHWLTASGCEVLCAASGREVTELVRTHAVGLVITDVLMPDGDGLEVITSLRRSAPTTKVLAISGGGSHLRATDCLAFAKGLGAHGVLMKPFNREQFLAAVNKVAPFPTEGSDGDAPR
jgi:CheY-like chemotaxis protein